MKALLLHGPGEVGSRKKLTDLTKNFTGEILRFDNQIPQVEFDDLISQQSLFSEKRLIILENPAESLKVTAVDEVGVGLVVWLDHEIDLSKTLYKSLKAISAQIINFPEAKEISVFPFLDNLAEGKKEAFLELEKLTAAGFEFHYLITMVFYLLRNLVVTPKNAPDFVKKKILKQRNRFSAQTIVEFYHYLLGLNFKVNSGEIESSQANFLMAVKFLGPDIR